MRSLKGLIVLVLALVATGCASMVGCGLGKAAIPVPVLFTDINICLADAAKTLTGNNGRDAAAFCLEARKEEAIRAKVAANAASTACRSGGGWRGGWQPSYQPSHRNGSGGIYGSGGNFSSDYAGRNGSSRAGSSTEGAQNPASKP